MRLNRKTIAIVISVAVAFAYTMAPAFAASGITKEETVYVVTDATGTEEEVIVSDHLKNDMEADTIDDASNLTEIENVKGEETFDKGKGEQIIWDAKGNDIFYEGVSKDKTPVTMDITYKLDGAKVEGSELKDKKGTVEIEIDFENNAKAKVDGKEVTVPFIAMTGFIASDDTFSDIEIDHGKVIDDGDKKIVVGMAAPGLADSLDVDLDKYDIDLSDSIRITGTASGFDVQDIMTVVTNSVFEDIDTDDMDIDFDDEVNALDDGAKKLVEGSDELYKGLEKLDDSMPEFKEGVESLDNGAVRMRGELKGNMKKIADATRKLNNGTRTILSGLKTMKKGLDKGDETPENPGAISALDQVAGGLDKANEEAMPLIEQVSDDKGMLKQEIQYELASKGVSMETITQLSYAIGAANQMGAGVPDASNAIKKVSAGLKEMSDRLGYYDKKRAKKGKSQTTLIGGMTVIDSGLAQLNSEASKSIGKKGKLTKALNRLVNGTGKLRKGTNRLVNGVDQLEDGSSKLKKGMSQFYNEGIKELVTLYRDDIKGTVDNLRDTIDAGADYRTFTRLPKGMDGNVKFIYKTSVY